MLCVKPFLIMWCASSARVRLVNTSRECQILFNSPTNRSQKLKRNREFSAFSAERGQPALIASSYLFTDSARWFARNIHFTLMGQIRVLTFFVFFVLIVDGIFTEKLKSSFKFRARLFCSFLHFSSSENAGDEINEDSQHVSCLAVTSKADSQLSK